MSVHNCPIDGCEAKVPYSQLMCRTHWRMVPLDQSRELYGAWSRGAGAGTERHANAMAAAVHAVEAKLAT